jgi:hypothetical protein
MREALLLDLGALVFELQRQGRREPELLQAKAAELSAVDNEVRALANALDAGQSVLELVATGVAGSCGNCGSILSTDARYCHACGAQALPSIGTGQKAGRGPELSPGAGPSPPQAPPAFPGRPVAGRPELDDPASRPSGRLDRMRELVRRRDTDG